MPAQLFAKVRLDRRHLALPVVGLWLLAGCHAVISNPPANEWYENTYIEPSVNLGDQYLQITGQYLKGWVEP